MKRKEWVIGLHISGVGHGLSGNWGFPLSLAYQRMQDFENFQYFIPNIMCMHNEVENYEILPRKREIFSKFACRKNSFWMTIELVFCLCKVTVLYEKCFTCSL